MARPREELRLKGFGLGARFALTMTLALTVVLAVAGYTLHATLANVVENIQQRQLLDAIRLNAGQPPVESKTDMVRVDKETGVARAEVRYGDGLDQDGTLYQIELEDEEGDARSRFRFVMPAERVRLGEKVVGLLVGILVAVVLVAAGVAFWIASQVTQPIHKLVTAVRQIAKGDLGHPVRVRGGGEVELLARAIDRMQGELEAAQETELELSIHEREMRVAGEVRESLLPLGTPAVEGFDLVSGHFPSEHPGGDCHDFVPLQDGSVGVLVAEVSGQGVPATVVGATARAYLRSELSRGGDVASAFRRVNAELGQDVRRGMFVTALYAVLAPGSPEVTVVSAGHKVPLVRLAGDAVRTVHPEGIALGLDRGPVFDRALQVERIRLEPGERIVLSTTGPLRVRTPKGEELGEKRFYSLLLKHSKLEMGKYLGALRRTLRKFSGEEPFPADISLVIIERSA